MTTEQPEPVESWFTFMARRHCGRDYGSERHNAYHFYRRVYGMTASQALETVNRWITKRKEPAP